MLRSLLFLSLACAIAATPALAAIQIPLENAGFEDGLKSWTATRAESMLAASPKAASLGKSGLLITDDSTTDGAVLTGSSLLVKENAVYMLRFWGRMESKSGGSNVKLEFLDQNQKPLKGVTVPRGWPGVSVKYPFGFTDYEVRVGTPAGAKTMRVVIETWGGATSVTSLDDFTLFDITDGKLPEVDLAPLLAEAKAAKAAGRKVPKIVLKVDDLGQHRDAVHVHWQRFVDEIQKRKIKSCIGIVFQTMDTDCPKYVDWIKKLHATGLFEFWNHGYDHKMWKEDGKQLMEFLGTPYEQQKQHMTRSNQLAREKLSFPMKTFGPPGGGMDESTFKILEEDPDIKVIMFPGPPRDIPGKVGLPRNFAVGIEYTTFLPSYPNLVEGYMHNLDNPYFVLQGHPKAWGPERWNSFVQQLDFLQDMDAEFVFASDFAPK